MATVLLAISLLLCLVSAKVELGNQHLRDSSWSTIQGHRVAILTNPSGVFADSLEHIVDVMAVEDSKNDYDLVAIFGPEHGFRGEKQAETSDPAVPYVDQATGLPVYSAYALSVEEMADIFVTMNISAVVVDMQDVGVRLYTFVWTMYNVQNATAQATNSQRSVHQSSMKFVILDRPNPLGGDLVDGPVVDMDCCSSGYGLAPIPHVHGMTMGELGTLFYANYLPGNYSLDVVKTTGWHRQNSWTDLIHMGNTLPWVPPSPNIPTPTTVFAFASTVFLEATTVAEGRGTTTPFELFGAPFVSDPQELARRLNAFCASDGAGAPACARAAYFQPTFSKYNYTAVPGVQWLTSQRQDDASCSASGADKAAKGKIYRTPFLSATVILRSFMELAEPKDSFVWDGSWFGHPGTELIDDYAGTPDYRLMLGDSSLSAEDIYYHFQPQAEEFRAFRKPFLLYL
jgi:uncharacterized protein YbbC (DUF1343 family)